MPPAPIHTGQQTGLPQPLAHHLLPEKETLWSGLLLGELVTDSGVQRQILSGEAARALEVNPNVLHRWRREFRQGPGNVFPGNGSGASRSSGCCRH
jgi:hypothetical protein